MKIPFHEKGLSMAIENGKLLQLPQGTEGIHLEEALRHRRITRELNDLYTTWGFLPVKTPIFDFYDNYRQLITPAAEEGLYRLMGRGGELLMLRSDVTLFLARQMGMTLKVRNLPVRVSYSDAILRHQNREDISKNEFFQTGVELIGVEGFQGDMEILLLLNAVLERFFLPAFLHLGSRSLFRHIVPAETEPPFLKEVLKIRDGAALTEALLTLHPKESAEAYSELLLFIGSPNEFQQFLGDRADSIDPQVVREGEYLLKLGRELLPLGFSREIRIDLSEIGSQPYHTGIVFQVYMEGIASAVVSGGRYDELLENFGIKAPSVGFSLLLRKLEALLPREGKAYTMVTAPDTPEGSEETRFARKYRKAEALRKTGRNVTL